MVVWALALGHVLRAKPFLPPTNAAKPLVQGFADVRDNGTVAAADVARAQARFFPSLRDASPVDVSLFHVDYASPGFSGAPRRLSGLVALPACGAPRGLVLYFHSTTTEIENVPSRYRSTGGPTEAELAIAAFAAGGYAVIAPDYIGLGDDPGVHPYALASVNCASGLDMVAPVRLLAAAHRCTVAARLYITGYSEGGAVAMWAAKRLEQARDAESGITGIGAKIAPPQAPNPKPSPPREGSVSLRTGGEGPAESEIGGILTPMELAGSAPISGAYDLSGVEVRSILSSQSNPKWLAARFFLAGYLGYAFSRLDRGERLGDIFVPSFASYVSRVFGGGRSDLEIVRDLAQKGLQVGAIRTIKRALQPALVAALESQDGSNPLVSRLLRENCFDWRPRLPLCLVCLSKDRLVPPENAQRAVEAMRKRGGGPEIVDRVVIANPSYDHITFLPRGLEIARNFFDGGFAAARLAPALSTARGKNVPTNSNNRRIMSNVGPD